MVFDLGSYDITAEGYRLVHDTACVAPHLEQHVVRLFLYDRFLAKL